MSLFWHNFPEQLSATFKDGPTYQTYRIFFRKYARILTYSNLACTPLNAVCYCPRKRRQYCFQHYFFLRYHGNWWTAALSLMN